MILLVLYSLVELSLYLLAHVKKAIEFYYSQWTILELKKLCLVQIFSGTLPVVRKPFTQ